MYHEKPIMKLTSSASEHNQFLTYVCLIGGIRPTNSSGNERTNSIAATDSNVDNELQDDEHIRVERSKALHELIESQRKDDESAPYINSYHGSLTEANPTSCDESEHFDQMNENPNILKLTKMKWLTEDRAGCPDSSSGSISPVSSSSQCSTESPFDLNDMGLGDKFLSTIIRLDKEHNMFGISNIAIVGSNTIRKHRTEDDKPVFPQTAIVQICCGKKYCKHRSNTDLPASLKCGGCRSCCFDSGCPVCPTYSPCVSCEESPCQPICTSCPKGKCCCKGQCSPKKCYVDCTTCYGLKVTLNRKPVFEPPPIELTPRSSCILQKPYVARSCHHTPQCVPPTSCFPYLMPCFWPARAGAPCTNPTRCFHNPPCPAPRRYKPPIPAEYSCPKYGKCEDGKGKSKCTNISCLGNNPSVRAEFIKRYPDKSVQEKPDEPEEMH